MGFFRADRTPRVSLRALLLAVCVLVSLAHQDAAGGSYGPGLSADALSNTRIGGPWQSTTSYGFRSVHSGALASLRLYVIWSGSSSGYNGGTGGSLLVSIQTDDGTSQHHPSGQTMASYLHADPMSKGNFPVLAFSSPAQLVAGVIYHVVITNPDPDPVTNYVSVNSLWMRKGEKPRQPLFADGDWFQLLGYSTKPNWWAPVENGGTDSYTPIVELQYADGFSTGVGYMEVWTESTKAISGSSEVRETFTVSGTDRLVSGVTIRLRRVAGSAPLTVRLENANGTLVESANIAGIDTNFTWISCTFPAVRMLTRGTRYNLTLQAPAGTSYEAFPIREGSSSNVQFSSASYFADGYAQFTTNGSWMGWDQWSGIDRRDADLQFLFTEVVEVPKSADVGTMAGPAEPLSIVSYPNPFNPSTTIQYHLDVAADISLEVVDVRGAVVARLVEGGRQPVHTTYCGMQRTGRPGTISVSCVRDRPVSSPA